MNNYQRLAKVVILFTLIAFALWGWVSMGHRYRVINRMVKLHIINSGNCAELLYSSSAIRAAYHILLVDSDCLIAGSPSGLVLTKMDLKLALEDPILSLVIERVLAKLPPAIDQQKIEWLTGQGESQLADVFIAKLPDGSSLVYVNIY
jgi:hypothetical protein